MHISDRTSTYVLGTRVVKRLGYGAMQLAGPGAFGLPRDHDQAVAVLREVVELGVDHIDTSDYYGPYVVNELIRDVLHPYPDHLTIVTKVGAKRGPDGSWNNASTPAELRSAVHDNLKRLKLERLEVVNFRTMHDENRPTGGSIEEPITVLAELQQQGLIASIGVSNVTQEQVAEARRLIKVACVQNKFNIAHRGDEELIADLAKDGIPYVPFYPLSGFSEAQNAELQRHATELSITTMQLALAWLLNYSPNILLIPGTSSIKHLHQNLAVADIHVQQEVVAALDSLSVVL